MSPLKHNDVLRWDGGNGILVNGQEYLVWQAREGARCQEFTLKHKGWQIVEPIIYWEAGEPFIRPVTGGKAS